MCWRFVAFVLTLGSVAAAASASQDFVVAQSQTEERVVGLLRLPEIYGDYPCQAFEAKRVNVYTEASSEHTPLAVIERVNPILPPERPDCDSPIVVVRRSGVVSGTEPFPSDESGEDFTTAVVYERSGRWFRIALSKGSGWIQRDNDDGFLPYPEILISESFQTYLRPGWDGNLWREPGVGSAMPAPDSWRTHRSEEIPVRITTSRKVGNDIWIRIRFETEVCGKSMGSLPSLEGWIPAHRASRATSVWFYSRGC